MALAILELLTFDKAGAKFNIDTGTNKYYKLKIGRNTQQKSGVDWVDDVYFSTPVSINEASGSLLNSTKDISVPFSRFEKGNAYVQLFSFKTAEGKSPAFSQIVEVPMGVMVPDGDPIDFASTLSSSTAMNTIEPFKSVRKIPCSSHLQQYSKQASVDDLLASIVKIATPVVLNLLGGSSADSKQTTPSVSTNINGGGLTDILTLLLKSILGNIPGTPDQSTSRQQSLINVSLHGNRFLGMDNNPQFSKPFIFGIDDALLASLVEPVIQVLPQLINAANQKRLQLKQADNKLVSDILSDVNRRMLLEQLLQSRNAPSSNQAVNGGDLNQLMQLLQQVPAGTAPQSTVANASVNQSLFFDTGHSSTLSSKAVVSFVTADPILWDGTQKVLFAKNQGLQLKIQLNVAEPVPKNPLPKAILKFVFKDSSDQSISYEKSFKQKNIQPNNMMAFSFTQDELSHLPVNKGMTLIAEMRWLSPKNGTEYKALGSLEFVLVNKYSLKQQGNAVSPEMELTDMKQFRPFWNKVWEALSLGTVSSKTESDKKYLWELNVSLKYTILLSCKQDTNGLMETKILKGSQDDQSLTERTDGRMKAGIELSLSELNKLMPLWNGNPSLDRERLEAFYSEKFVKDNAGEFVYNIKLKGRVRERGMIWIIPIFKLFEFTLNIISKTNDEGQVIAVTEETARFPLPVSSRVLGIKSQ